VLLLGQVLALCITGTNTFSTLLFNHGVSIPAFQNIFIYLVLNFVYTPITIYKYGLAKYKRMLLHDGWKYFILAFFDVQGNYFAVLAFRYTTILSAQLINFWAIVVVVVVSFVILRVRYHWAQILGILVACTGMGLLMYSDHVHVGSTIKGGENPLKGDLFMLVAATAYGLTNVAEEFLVSKRPLYEVVGQLGLYGIFINGVQASIFDRNQFEESTWRPVIAGYIVGFTICMFTFYSLAPVVFRMASAAFFNISLLTANFWGLLIGIRLFGYTIFYLYGVAFTCIVLGLVIYYVLSDVMGESKKPWLGEDQKEGVLGVGTAKRALAKGEPDIEAEGDKLISRERHEERVLASA